MQTEFFLPWVPWQSSRVCHSVQRRTTICHGSVVSFPRNSVVNCPHIPWQQPMVFHGETKNPWQNSNLGFRLTISPPWYTIVHISRENCHGTIKSCHPLLVIAKILLHTALKMKKGLIFTAYDLYSTQKICVEIRSSENQGPIFYCINKISPH